MKYTPCPKCGCAKIIKSMPADYGDGDFEKKMAVTAEARWVFTGRNPDHPRGLLELYVCSDCGYTEWYCADPSDVPIGTEYRTEIIEHG